MQFNEQINEFVTDVKGRVEKVRTEAETRFNDINGKAQKVAKTSVDTVKKANDVVVGNAKTVANARQGDVKELIEVAKASVAKAREAGLQEVAKKPADFLPAEGKDQVVKAYTDTVEVLGKTRDQLVKVFTKGADSIKVTINGKPAAKKAAAKPAAKKAPAKRKPAAKKAAPKAAAAPKAEVTA